MAKDRFDDDSDEEINKKQDDDDFGLPDLDYDLLDEDDNTSISEQEIAETVAKNEEEEKKPAPAVEYDFGGGDDEEFSDEEMKAVQAALDNDDEDDFEEQVIRPSSGKKTDEKAFKMPSNYKPYVEEESSSAGFGKYIVIGVIVMLLVGFVLMYFSNRGTKQVASNEEPKSEKVETQQEPAETTTPVESKPVESTPTETSKPVENKTTTTKASTTSKNLPPVSSTPGQIATISSKTGKAYIVVGSFFDEDQAQDFANDLASRGVSPKIIAPYGDVKYHRVVIAEYATYPEAQSKLNGFKATYGADIWTLKY